MKKLTFSFLLSITLIQFSLAQNTFPSSGSVGIGTTSPSSPLDVVGSWGVFSSTAHATSQFVQDYTNKRGIYLGYDSSGQIGVIASNSASAASNLSFWNYSGSAWFEGMRLTSSGYLGVGTSSPNTLLDVRQGAISIGNGNLDPNYTNLNFLANTGRLLIGQNRTSGANETDFISNQGVGAPGGFAFYNHDNSNNETQLIWIQGNGNVLIDRTSQNNTSYKLDVNGPAHATSIVVNSGGADFVFAPKYKLATLSFVEKYINQNHHLPEIPSAKQMEADGLNVGENEIKLLQKVEELTLYLIEKDKKQKEDENRMQSQQAEIDVLKQQVQSLIKASNKN